MLIIDRFEGNFAVVEYSDGTFDIPKHLIPSGIKEGDVIEISVKLNKKETQAREKQGKININDFFES